MSITTSSTNRNYTLSLSQRNKTKKLIKSVSACNVYDSIYNKNNQKITFQSKTRNKNNEQNLLKYTSSENGCSNLKLTFNSTFHITNLKSKLNKFQNNKTKFMENFFRRKKNIDENIKINKNKNINKTYNSQYLYKYSNKKINYNKTVIKSHNLLNIKQYNSKTNNIKQSIKINKIKGKVEFENKLYKKNNNSITKKLIRSSSVKLNNRLNTFNNKKIENNLLQHLNISLSDSSKKLGKLKKNYYLIDNINSNRNNNSNINDYFLIKDLDGPENIHFILVNIIQKGKQQMSQLSSKFNEN